MTANLTPATESRLARLGASLDAATDLLDQREADKLALLVSELAQVEADMPATVPDQITLHTVNDLIGRAAKAHKELEAARRERLRPLEAETRSVNDLFRCVTDRLKALETRGKGLVLAWEQAERQRVEAAREVARLAAEQAARELAEAEARAAKARSDAERAAAELEAQQAAQRVDAALVTVCWTEPVRGVRSEHATTGVRYEWTVEVVDDAQVPRQYLVVDMVRLRAAVKSGLREIPGCNVSQRPIVATRTR